MKPEGELVVIEVWSRLCRLVSSDRCFEDTVIVWKIGNYVPVDTA
jgi:hypothetical protein